MFFACFLKGFERESSPSLCDDHTSLLLTKHGCDHSLDVEERSRSKSCIQIPIGWCAMEGEKQAQNRPARTAEISVSTAADPLADTKRSHNNQPFSATNWYLERNVLRRRLYLATTMARERRRTVGIRMKKCQNEPSASARNTSFPLRIFA